MNSGCECSDECKASAGGVVRSLLSQETGQEEECQDCGQQRSVVGGAVAKVGGTHFAGELADERH